MLTLQKEEKLIDKLKSLTELELQPIMDELIRHLDSNKMSHLYDSSEDELNEARQELSELQHEVNKLTDEKDRLVDLVSETKDSLSKVIEEEASFDWMQDKIQNIIDTL